MSEMSSEAIKNDDIEFKSLKLKVLILDDDILFREDMGEYLENCGFDVIQLTDPDQLSKTEHGRAILLLDLAMPRMSGPEVLQRLSRASHPPAVILVSGSGEDVIHAAAEGAQTSRLRVLGWLRKPFDPADLVALLREGGGEDVAVSRQSRPIPNSCLAAALLDALESGDVPAAFQPQVDPHTFAFKGAEILLGEEWSKIGHVSPVAMLDEARRNPRLMSRLTLEMVKAAATGCAMWQSLGFQETVSVNVPLDALLQPESVEAIASQVREAGISASSMVLELTEDSLYGATSGSIMALVQARLAGFGIALDDVGQRNSGLLQLARLPITELKIDRDLLVQARDSEKARRIFGLLAELGRDLSLRVVAEGVETAVDLSFAIQEHVDVVQGYWTGRKMPLSNLLDKISGKSAAMSNVPE